MTNDTIDSLFKPALTLVLLLIGRNAIRPYGSVPPEERDQLTEKEREEMDAVRRGEP